MKFANELRAPSACAPDVKQNRASADPNVPRDTFTSAVLSRAAHLGNIIDATSARLAEVRREKMGSWPEPGDSQDPQPAADGQFEAILQLMDDLIRRADGMGWHAIALRDSI